MGWSTVLLLLVMMPLGALAAPGGSLFEQVAVRNNAVIWPLDALLDHIAGQLAEGRKGMRTVLIPVGRSLQRHAAGDAHYFDSPRAVIAITGEPVGVTAPLLKDRLYLGHHAAAGVLEVISYHEGTGRFEFFIVDDYRAGGTPHLRAGNRGMCLACHQNDAPIFSRPNWDETSANPIIARLLASTGRDYEHLPWRHGVDVPLAIDESTERANLLPVAQRLWAACNDDACRRQLLWRTLRSRLTGLPETLALTEDPALASLVDTWRRQWPEGFVIPEPDIPNRQPFAATLPWQTVPTDAATLRQLADVAERFDALALRPPRERLPLDDPQTPARVFHALGQFFSDTDVAALSGALAAGPGAVTEAPLDCRFAERGTRRNVDCRLGAQLAFQGREEGGRLMLDRLVIDGRSRPGLLMRATQRGFVSSDAPPRLADGRALRALRLDATGPVVELTDDLARLQASVAALNVDATAPLQRRTVLSALLTALDAAGPMPVEAVRPLAATDRGERASDPALAPFYRHCALCHSDTDAFPPGFLRGDTATVHQRLTDCAPRMLRRLAMWHRPAGAREKTPMPPPASAQAADLQRGSDLNTMRAWLTDRLAAAGQPADAFDHTAYADLPACAIYPESAHVR